MLRLMSIFILFLFTQPSLGAPDCVKFLNRSHNENPVDALNSLFEGMNSIHLFQVSKTSSESFEKSTSGVWKPSSVSSTFLKGFDKFIAVEFSAGKSHPWSMELNGLVDFGDFESATIPQLTSASSLTGFIPLFSISNSVQESQRQGLRGLTYKNKEELVSADHNYVAVKRVYEIYSSNNDLIIQNITVLQFNKIKDYIELVLTVSNFSSSNQLSTKSTDKIRLERVQNKRLIDRLQALFYKDIPSTTPVQ